MAPGFSSLVSGFRQQLLACLPESWRNRIGGKTAPYELKLHEDGTSATLFRDGSPLHEVGLDSLSADTTLASLLKPHKYPLVLELPGDWVLERRLALPAAARENLRQVIGFELDRVTPFQEDQVYFDYEVDSARPLEGDLLGINMVLVLRSRVQPWLDGLNRAGIPVDRIVPEKGSASLNLLPPEHRAGPNMKQAAMKAVPAVILVLLLAAVLLLPLWQAREVVLDLQKQEQDLRKQAGGVIKLREKLNHKLEGMEKIRDYWREAVPPLEVLQVLTRLLPDDTYLQQLDIRGNKLTMRGLSGQASALIGLLEESAVFEDPHFLSPVTQQRGKELFHLGATIRTPFPYEMVTAPGAKAVEKGQG